MTTTRALSIDQEQNTEERLVCLLLKLVVLPDEAVRLLSDWQFASVEHGSIVAALLHWTEKQNYDYSMFRETLPPDLQENADRLLAIEQPLPDAGKASMAVAFHLARLRLHRVEREMTRSTNLLGDIDREDREVALSSVGRLMEERRETEEQLNKLSQLLAQSGTATFSS